MRYILNTNTGTLHTEECAKGDGAVEPGHHQYFNNLRNAHEHED